MHEFSLMNGLLENINNIAKQQNAKKVVKIMIKLGALTNISAGHFREHFEEAAKNSIAENAELNIEEATDIYAKEAQDILIKEIEVI